MKIHKSYEYNSYRTNSEGEQFIGFSLKKKDTVYTYYYLEETDERIDFKI
jgi:hypothetical protein